MIEKLNLLLKKAQELREAGFLSAKCEVVFEEEGHTPDIDLIHFIETHPTDFSMSREYVQGTEATYRYTFKVTL